ncbi:MAG: hypothetical protein WCL51_15705 [Bacteroidota bacterium]
MEGIVTVGTRVFHQELGEGMINKVTKDEYEVMFMSGNKRIFQINGTELTIVSNFKISKPVTQTIPDPPKVKETPQKKKHEEKKAEKVIEEIIVVKPVPEPEFNNIILDEQNISVGLRVSHKDYGEGMVNKITPTQYEVHFMDGKRIKFAKNDTELTAFKTIVPPIAKVIEDKKDTSNFKMSFKQKIKATAKTIIPPEVPIPEIKKETFVSLNEEIIEEKQDYILGTKIQHQILGEGIINKITDKYYEVVFLDGKKSRCLKTDKNLSEVNQEVASPTKTIVNIAAETINKEEIKKDEAEKEKDITKEEQPKKEDKSPEINTIKDKAYLSTGSRIYHKVKGEGMIAKIKDDEYEIIFMDGSMANYSINDKNLSIINDEALDNAIKINVTKTTAISEPSSQRVNKSAIFSPNSISLGSKWKGGILILKPLNSSLQKKEYTIESFFQIILSIYKRVASLEEIININNNISQKEKQDIQMQIKAINRSLVAFNMLFKEKEDYFSEKE